MVPSETGLAAGRLKADCFGGERQKSLNGRFVGLERRELKFPRFCSASRDQQGVCHANSPRKKKKRTGPWKTM